MAKQSKPKFMYYVRIYINNEERNDVRYITAHRGNVLEWQAEEKPLAMSKPEAEECFYRLTVNGCFAEIIYQLNNMTETQGDYINGWLDKMIKKAVEKLKQDKEQ